MQQQYRPQRPRGPFCQSCGKPMTKPEYFGLNADKSKSEEYCRYCYRFGKFTNPDMTLEEMVDKVATFMAERRNISKEEAINVVKGYMPRLKRWQTGEDASF